MRRRRSSPRCSLTTCEGFPGWMTGGGSTTSFGGSALGLPARRAGAVRATCDILQPLRAVTRRRPLGPYPGSSVSLEVGSPDPVCVSIVPPAVREDVGQVGRVLNFRQLACRTMPRVQRLHPRLSWSRAIVFSIAGVLLGLLIKGRLFGVVMGGMGVIALAGIVVNKTLCSWTPTTTRALLILLTTIPPSCDLAVNAGT